MVNSGSGRVAAAFLGAGSSCFVLVFIFILCNVFSGVDRAPDEITGATPQLRAQLATLLREFMFVLCVRSIRFLRLFRSFATTA